MKIKLILLIISVLIENGFTQNITGKVIYNFQTKLSNSSPLNKPAYLLFDIQKSIFIYCQGSKNTIMQYNDGSTVTGKPDLDKKIEYWYQDSIGAVFYKDFQKQTLVMRDFFQKTPYLSQEPKLPQLNWKIENADSLIGKFKCQKAMTRFRGRNYIAWFATEIPISNGPWKFHGLPGLILEVRDDKQEVKFEFQSLEMPFNTTTKIEAPTDGKKVDFDTYKKGDMIEFELLKKKILSSMSNRGSNFQIKMEAYNPIEKEYEY